MTHEELEFSISQYLDGTLPAGERLVLEARFAEDADARQLLVEYRQLDGVLKNAALPAVQWEAFASHLSGVVAQAAGDGIASENETDVEYLVSQYLDGTLSAEERAAFEVRLETDAGAATLLAEHQRVHTLVKTSLPLPAVRWDALAEHLSGVVADAGAKPIFSFKWARTAGRIAIAACVLLATMVGVQIIRTNGHGRTKVARVTPSTVAPASVAIVTGPQFEKPTGKPVVDIEIGGPAVAQAKPEIGGTAIEVEPGASVQFADVVLSRPSRVVIAAGDESAQDIAQMPY